MVDNASGLKSMTWKAVGRVERLRAENAVL
jgi:hypothetical protein